MQKAQLPAYNTLSSTKKMNIRHLFFLIMAVVASVTSGCASGQERIKESETNKISMQSVDYGQPTEIKVILDGEKFEEGIRLKGTPTFSLFEPGPQEFRVKVTNFFPEEVFIVTTGYRGMGIDIDRYSEEEFFSFPGPESSDPYHNPFYPLLKRLRPSFIQEDGSVVSLGFSSFDIRGSASVLQDPLIDVDLVRRARCTLTIHIRGYFRSTGREFYGSADIPIKFKEVEQGGGINSVRFHEKVFQVKIKNSFLLIG